MDVVMVASEAVPFAKTGGLADVMASLPAELEHLGHNPVLFLPGYRSALECGQQMELLPGSVSVPIGSRVVEGGIVATTLPGTNVRVYLIHQDDYFNRDYLYGIGSGDYVDNCERFVFFCRAVLQAVGQMHLPVDVFHCHDWQAALIPAYLRVERPRLGAGENIPSLFTIHNLAYQGQFWHWDMLLTGLDWKYFNWKQLEFYGKLNLMKAGLVFADALNTVSPRYAEEIQSAPLGCGLEGVLHDRRDVLSGIMNGVDYSVWNPAHDPHLPRNFDLSNWQTQKPICKAELQKELGLAVKPDVPLVGVVSRLTEQKGIDLIVNVMQDWCRGHETQWVILGSGDVKHQEMVQAIAEQSPKKVALRLGFSEALAHRIEAGADIFLMPSRYEPCGLNQLYSLKYGTVPLVRATGGLADSVTDATPENVAKKTATGFSFQEYSSLSLADSLRRAEAAYRNREIWTQIVNTGMAQDWSWARSAKEYVQLYESLCAHRRQPACV